MNVDASLNRVLGRSPIATVLPFSKFIPEGGILVEIGSDGIAERKSVDQLRFFWFLKTMYWKLSLRNNTNEGTQMFPFGSVPGY